MKIDKREKNVLLKVLIPISIKKWIEKTAKANEVSEAEVARQMFQGNIYNSK